MTGRVQVHPSLAVPQPSWRDTPVPEPPGHAGCEGAEPGQGHCERARLRVKQDLPGLGDTSGRVARAEWAAEGWWDQAGQGGEGARPG